MATHVQCLLLLALVAITAGAQACVLRVYHTIMIGLTQPSTRRCCTHSPVPGVVVLRMYSPPYMCVRAKVCEHLACGKQRRVHWEA